MYLHKKRLNALQEFIISINMQGIMLFVDIFNVNYYKSVCQHCSLYFGDPAQKVFKENFD